MLTVACVLKSGGDFTPDYVVRLENAVRRHLTIDHLFVCLTDELLYGTASNPLTTNLRGWWAKLELFTAGLLVPPVLYFDLDTIIMGNIDPLAVLVRDSEFVMLQRFKHPRQFASGIMGWNKEHPFLLANAPQAGSGPEWQRVWDQRYISSQLAFHNVCPVAVQRAVGVHSYKIDVRTGDKGLKGADIVCFHGTPRPHEVDEAWVKENWV